MKRKSLFSVTVFILLMIIGVCMFGTIRSRGADRSIMDERYRKAMEESYIQEVRGYLESEHMKNSGITLTKVTYEDGSVQYEMLIHNRTIDCMNTYELQKLQQELQKISFPVANSTVTHEFLRI